MMVMGLGHWVRVLDLMVLLLMMLTAVEESRHNALDLICRLGGLEAGRKDDRLLWWW